jgi:bifunctional UDP-N-acetylglucosamine pyrophosphorylase/glucosamine-1-phosphate N-acetyltransferase
VGNFSKNAKFVKKKNKLRLEILEQKRLEDGMAGAVVTAEEWIGDCPFLVVSSNDIVADSIFELLKSNGTKKSKVQDAISGFLVAKKVREYFPGGYLKVEKDGTITGIVEKPGAGREPSDLVNIVFHLHMKPRKLFEELRRVKTNRDDRYEVALDRLMKRGEKFMALPYSGLWRPVKYPWHLRDVWKIIFERLVQTSKINGYHKSAKNFSKISRKTSIAKTAIMRGDVIIEDGVKIFDHAVIQGPAYLGCDVIVANNALVRESHLGAKSVAGFGTEIARSFLGQGVWTHTNYIGDSVIANNTSFGSGTVTGNLRLDEKPVSVAVDGQRVACGSNKLGAIIGENVRIGINVSLMPGVKIGNNSFIGAGISVARDVPDRKFVYGTWELTMKDNSATINPSAREIMMQRLKE